jgi:hypothetical protein
MCVWLFKYECIFIVSHTYTHSHTHTRPREPSKPPNSSNSATRVAFQSYSCRTQPDSWCVFVCLYVSVCVRERESLVFVCIIYICVYYELMCVYAGWSDKREIRSHKTRQQADSGNKTHTHTFFCMCFTYSLTPHYTIPHYTTPLHHTSLHYCITLHYTTLLHHTTLLYTYTLTHSLSLTHTHTTHTHAHRPWPT